MEGKTVVITIHNLADNYDYHTTIIFIYKYIKLKVLSDVVRLIVSLKSKTLPPFVGHMHHSGREINQLKEVLKKAEEPLTAQEIQSIIEEYENASVNFGSSHRIATILGRLESRTNIEVIQDCPYKYRIDE